MARNVNDPNWRDYQHPAMTYEAPKQLRRFRTAFAVVVSTLLAGGLWTGLWFAAAGFVQAQVARVADAQVAQSGVAAYETLTLSGFPTRIHVTLTRPHFVGAVLGSVSDWQGETLTISARPWLPWRWHLESPGRHTIAFADTGMKLAGAIEGLTLDLVLGGWRGDAWPERVTVDVNGVSLSGDATVAMEALSATLTHNGDAQASATGMTLALTGTGITLPLAGGWSLGDTIASIDASVRVVGAVRPQALQAHLVEELTAWRDTGGAVDVEHLKLRMGPLGLATVGTLALDGALQPQGAFSAKFEGLFQVLEGLRAKGLVRDTDALLATVTLSALSKRPANGGPPTLNVALSVQDGTLSLGPIAVMKMPVIDWPHGHPQAPVEAETLAPHDYKSGPAIY